MSFIDRFRNRPEQNEEDASSVDDGSLPIPRYDKLSDKEVTKQLHELSQVELAAIEEYEREHAGRAVVLDRLRYMRSAEPMPGYDTLTEEQVLKALEGADGQALRAVRDYERKFPRHSKVSAEIERALPSSQASAEEDQARQHKRDLVANRPGA